MRGATRAGGCPENPEGFQLTRPMRGATGVTPQTIRDRIISTHTPHAGRDSGAYSYRMSQQISTHTPHAGRDATERLWANYEKISTHTPHAGRDKCVFSIDRNISISTHTPHAGRDEVRAFTPEVYFISTHTPHAGRDFALGWIPYIRFYFNSHAPCGARPLFPQRKYFWQISTHTPHAGRDAKPLGNVNEQLISTHTPHAGRDPIFTLSACGPLPFQLTRPMRGATRWGYT